LLFTDTITIWASLSTLESMGFLMELRTRSTWTNGWPEVPISVSSSKTSTRNVSTSLLLPPTRVSDTRATSWLGTFLATSTASTVPLPRHPSISLVSNPEPTVTLQATLVKHHGGNTQASLLPKSTLHGVRSETSRGILPSTSRTLPELAGADNSAVIDMSLLQWLQPSQVNIPPFFATMQNRNETFAGNDITALVERAGYTEMLECLVDIIQVGFVDSISIGCVASDIVLYLSLVFILGAVSIKFFMALYFGWFMSWKLGNFKNVSYAERMKRAAEVEQWSDDIYRAAPANMRPNAKGNRKTVFLPTTSRFSKAEPMLVNSRPATAYSMADAKRTNQPSMYGNRLTPGGFHNSPPDSPMLRNSRSSTSLPFRDESGYSLSDQTHQTNANPYGCPFPLANVVPQPAPDFRPFEYDLVHSICLVTAYSESYAGLRTTLDSLATTDYPNSHKMLLVICDGIVRGSDSKTNESTHEVVLSMMKEFIVHPDDAERYSCLAIADGGKRENKAIVYAGFYNYDNDTVEERKQQRVPMVLVAKVGNDDEQRQYQQAGRGKPGNRGKRDSQIILMSFLQKVIFDERMTQFEYEFFNAIWRVCGVPPDKFETVLCVDADTKVFPDSLTRMNACLVHDPDIMGLCGETKIANKKESWVTMIQGKFSLKDLAFKD
jgi:chitin synthase